VFPAQKTATYFGRTWRSRRTCSEEEVNATVDQCFLAASKDEIDRLFEETPSETNICGISALKKLKDAFVRMLRPMRRPTGRSSETVRKSMSETDGFEDVSVPSFHDLFDEANVCEELAGPSWLVKKPNHVMFGRINVWNHFLFVTRGANIVL